MDIFGLIPSFGGAIYTFVAFVVALSVIVAIHEYGHYIVGRWSGIHAEVFSLGFGPVIYSRHDKRGTKWQIAALPFGGYVKFLGDADAASGKDGSAMAEMDATNRRRTMHGAPLWARAATVAAGPAFNFALSFLVFAAVLFLRGTASEPLTVASLTKMPDAIVQQLQPGDEILAIEGLQTPAFENFSAMIDQLPIKPTLEYTILRDGRETIVEGPYPYPALIKALQPSAAAMDIGMKVGDVIVAVDGAPITAFKQLQDLVASSNGRVLQVQIWRDGELLDFALAPRSVDLPLPDGSFETRMLIGITGGFFFEAKTERPDVLTALGFGVEQTVFIVQSSLSGMYHMITGAISACNISGPIGIAQASGAMASQGASSFVWFIAVLSTAVGLLNLFPIPVLDGGHLVFYAYEAVFRRPPSDGALRVMMGAGFVLLMSLMVFAVTNDLFCP